MSNTKYHTVTIATQRRDIAPCWFTWHIALDLKGREHSVVVYESKSANPFNDRGDTMIVVLAKYAKSGRNMAKTSATRAMIEAAALQAVRDAKREEVSR